MTSFISKLVKLVKSDNLCIKIGKIGKSGKFCMKIGKIGKSDKLCIKRGDRVPFLCVSREAAARALSAALSFSYFYQFFYIFQSANIRKNVKMGRGPNENPSLQTPSGAATLEPLSDKNPNFSK